MRYDVDTIDFTSAFLRMINPKVARRTETDAWAEDTGVKLWARPRHDESIMQLLNWNIMQLSRGEPLQLRKSEERIDTVSDGDWSAKWSIDRCSGMHGTPIRA